MSATIAYQTGVKGVVQGRVCGTCGVSRELGMYITKTGRDVRTCRKCRDHSRKHFLRSKIKQPYDEWLARLAEQVRLFYDSPWQTPEVRMRIEQDLRALVEKKSALEDAVVDVVES